MSAVTAEREDVRIEEDATVHQIAVFQPPRLPYHDAIGSRFGVDRSGWKALVEAIFPTAKSVDSVVMALSYCRARKLDVFKRPVHIVPMWSSAAGGEVDTVWPGIAELRTTAFRTGQYAGCDEADFGPTLEQTFKGKVKNRKTKQWEDRTVTLQVPEWCRLTIYRDLNGRVCRFVGPKVKWVESYAGIGSSDVPNDMWESRPEGQIEKCAEAAALRRAFPEELGNQLTAEEMEGRRIVSDGPQESAPATPRRAPAPPPPPTVKAPPPPPAAAPAEKVEVEDLGEPEKLIAELDTTMTAATEEDFVHEAWGQLEETIYRMPLDAQQKARAIYDRHVARFETEAA